MKIALAQIRSVKGDINSNITHHLFYIDKAVTAGADAVIFPELSLTGYEPALADELATQENDQRLSIFQSASDTNELIIGIGLPVRTADGIIISMIVFEPSKPVQRYAKHYIHVDEEPFFVKGENPPGLLLSHHNIALAICYEISVPQHAEQSFNDGAQIYVASVVKTPAGVDKAIEQLSTIAKKYHMEVLMVNAVGFADGGVNGGKSSAWNSNGELVAQLSPDEEGLLVHDVVIHPARTSHKQITNR